MTRPRGRPAQGKGLVRDDILAAALTLLDEGGGQEGLALRIAVSVSFPAIGGNSC